MVFLPAKSVPYSNGNLASFPFQPLFFVSLFWLNVTGSEGCFSLLPWRSCSDRWILPTRDLSAQQRHAVATARKSLLLLMTELTFLLVFRVNQGTDRRRFFLLLLLKTVGYKEPWTFTDITHCCLYVCYIALFCKSVAFVACHFLKPEQRQTFAWESRALMRPSAVPPHLLHHRCERPDASPCCARLGTAGTRLPARALTPSSRAANGHPEAASAANQKRHEPRPNQWVKRAPCSARRPFYRP